MRDFMHKACFGCSTAYYDQLKILCYTIFCKCILADRVMGKSACILSRFVVSMPLLL